MKRALWFVPGVLAVAPWALLEAVGARREVVVITGTLPPSGELGVVLGAALVVAWLVAVLAGPPLFGTALLSVLWRRPASGAGAGALRGAGAPRQSRPSSRARG